eukprot:TRINITY_DN17409_c0_g1_i1.p1 TRINITY_DN17409_c0_g1~~TRINITY_DN17409_c0_g1_i1.p1  ORF type:complete len:282 (-),score=37.92 TRINITY_DN17409_c0_g1_i1:100-945(-)
MALLRGLPQQRFVWNEPVGQPANWTTWPEWAPHPMYVVPHMSLPQHVSPIMAPEPAHVPLPAFANDSKALATENFSDTSSTTCPEEEMASKSTSHMGCPGLAPASMHSSAPKCRVASRPEVKKNAIWQLLWCCERCNKASNSETKNAYQNMAESLGGRFHCIKKAEKIEGVPGKSKYVLVSDWRESKPLFRIFAGDPLMARPALVFIICSTAKSYDNAVQFAVNDPFVNVSNIHVEVLLGQGDDLPTNRDGLYAFMQTAAQMFASNASAAAVDPGPMVVKI